MEEAMESRLLAPRRCGARCTPPKPEASPVAPMMLPISVDVRSMDMTPGARCSCLSAPPWCLNVARDMADRFDVLLVRPLALGSRSASMPIPLPRGWLPLNGLAMSGACKDLLVVGRMGVDDGDSAMSKQEDARS